MARISGIVWALTIAAGALWLGATVIFVGVPQDKTGVTLLDAVFRFVQQSESVYGTIFTGIFMVVLGFILAGLCLLPGLMGTSPDAGYTEFGDGCGGDGD